MLLVAIVAHLAVYDFMVMSSVIYVFSMAQYGLASCFFFFITQEGIVGASSIPV